MTVEAQTFERKPPKLFYSKLVDEKHRRHFNNAIRRNARGGDHFVEFMYHKKDGSREMKAVKPYTSKKSKDGKYLLVGYAKDREELRSYRTDRIHHIKEAFWKGFEKQAAPRWRKMLGEIIKKRDLGRAEKFVYDIARGLPREATESQTPHSSVLRALPSIGKLPEGVMSGGLDNAVRKAMKENYHHLNRVNVTPLKEKLLEQKELRDFYRGFARRQSSRPVQSWVGGLSERLSTSVDPEEYINISHAGGKQHIEDVLAGKTKGYALEHSSNTGLQVHPLKFFDREKIAPREAFYAARGSVRHGDVPAVLTGKIKAKHLQGAPNLYEAGITHDGLKHMEDVKVQRLHLGDHGGYSANITDHISRAFDPFEKPHS